MQPIELEADAFIYAISFRLLVMDMCFIIMDVSIYFEPIRDNWQDGGTLAPSLAQISCLALSIASSAPDEQSMHHKV